MAAFPGVVLSEINSRLSGSLRSTLGDRAQGSKLLRGQGLLPQQKFDARIKIRTPFLQDFARAGFTRLDQLPHGKIDLSSCCLGGAYDGVLHRGNEGLGLLGISPLPDFRIYPVFHYHFNRNFGCALQVVGRPGRDIAVEDQPLDAARKEYVDLVEAGIVDPAKVVRTALENAVSVASVLLLTEATMTEIAEPKRERIAEPEMAM
jgi:hypothetical protein